MLQIGRGLQDLHHHKITHRDLKPENILLTHKYNPKKEFPDIRIADFGLSTTKLIMKTVAGTKEYLSPEQAKFSSYTNAVDIWAMGIIFDELLHGSTFYNGEDNKEVFHNICTIPYHVRDQEVSPEIKQILLSMLKKRPY
jgi:serine/threonine protein kinase